MELKLLQSHFEKAQKLALNLFQAASCVIPHEFSLPIIEQTTMDLMEFGFHARRVNELAQIDPSLISGANGKRFKYENSSLDAPLEENYGHALNRLRHPNTYSVGLIEWGGDIVFEKSSSHVIVSFARITTNDPRYLDKNVSIFGISFSFLTEVRTLMHAKYPQYGY
ncbi:hypothetical protein [Beijerinckia sp. L45]|uniref:hypothetical protein n=1 Tax=Beijerinckia sp. L45 TaxID=1641855 RepID=UPI00131B5D89|nr:hypothetical protein [Beijerinckia sp. L45]